MLGTAPAPDTVQLEISLSGLRSAHGDIRLCVWHGPAKFPNDTCAGQQIVVPAATPVVLVAVPLAPGDYAVSLLHDENGNGKLDKNFLGIPKEGVGFSQNPKISFGPPTYAASKFDMVGPQTEAIRMKYFL
ncbi:DUF2141 domain-containing protein [Sphingosinicellaceae bacterium]|nr:DUF2141 domain-containing protein [Sphingosinicellaceae bacterium]